MTTIATPKVAIALGADKPPKIVSVTVTLSPAEHAAVLFVLNAAQTDPHIPLAGLRGHRRHAGGAIARALRKFVNAKEFPLWTRTR